MVKNEEKGKKMKQYNNVYSNSLVMNEIIHQQDLFFS